MRTCLTAVPLLLLLCAVFSGEGHLIVLPAGFGTQELEPDPDAVLEPPSPVEKMAGPPCQTVTACNFTCELPDLVVTTINSTEYNCKDLDLMTFTVTAVSEDAVVRLRLDPGSKLTTSESLTVLEDGVELAMLTDSQEAWVASGGPNLILEYRQNTSNTDQIQMTLVSYNQTRENQTLTEMAGVFDVPEQTNWTGSPDYALNTERYWLMSLTARHINFTVNSLDLDPAAGDVLIIGGGRGPWDTEPAADLLTGKFPKRRYHVSGGEAFIYFLSRSHSQPRELFEISYEADPIVGPTTTVPTTTDRNHPPTPSDGDFQLPIYIKGIDPHRFLDSNDSATAELQQTLAHYADLYRHEHNINVWRSVHADDIRFTAWLKCDYASGWVHPDPNCVQVTWYIELLTVDGDWAFLETDLRGVITQYNNDINSDLGYQVSLTLDEVNETWWWAIAIILVPAALVAFILVMWMSKSSTKLKSPSEKNSSIADSDEGLDEYGNTIYKEVRTIAEEKDRQLREMVLDDETFRDHDPELGGTHRHRALQARLLQKPLKSALKAPKTAPVTYTNAAFEGDEGTPLSGGGGGGTQTFFPPDEPAPAAAAVAAPAAELPAAAASSELTEQLRLLNELNKTLKEEEKQAPGIELPRVNQLVQPAAPAAPKMYSINEDGTGTEVDAPLPGEKILQLDNDSGASSEDRKTSSV